MKKLLLSLFVGLIGFISFGNCQSVSKVLSNNADLSIFGFQYVRGSNEGFNFLFSSDLGDGINCLMFDQQYPSVDFYVDDEIVDVDLSNWNMVCVNSTNVKFYTLNTSLNYYKLHLSKDYFMDYFQPQYTSSQCQTEYNLIPISSVDQNYCVNNGLCPSDPGDNPGDYTGDLQFSNIYINDILHPGKQNIFVNIPDYIMWDYNVVGDNFNIYVGSGYDVDYINSIIDINSYRPTSSDFTDVFVGGLTLIFPYIVIVLFIVFIRKLIKRIFK